ncbi:hypothetical protein EDEG_02741 [Edhazardia aedis USNM 41457]|uniref:Palmitoyltransferase n=1 Tax=Edhazardia aedis (strain USNM 41457) TaxID=1003232 RepID=J9D4W3_EDHAE|nr:hypothetical protein EDEG_02741 [Edhazardia aedis USNM 41457]|eukprot:EJW02861.1 hypothetical protein EDEG_02741 [Edhazardia aedis USNM 41457]
MEEEIRTAIKYLEYILIASVYAYHVELLFEIYNDVNLIFRPILTYLLLLSIFYYTILIKKSPGSLSDYSDLEARGICTKCMRLKSSRTFHCDACRKCYYKRDHHCPWIGKCVAAGNFREFYLFIGFLIISILSRIILPSVSSKIGFFHNYLCGFLIIFFIFVNFLVCIDRTSAEFNKNNQSNSFIKYRSPWSKVDWQTYKQKLSKMLIDGNINNLWLIPFPFLIKKPRIV